MKNKITEAERIALDYKYQELQRKIKVERKIRVKLIVNDYTLSTLDIPIENQDFIFNPKSFKESFALCIDEFLMQN